MADLCILYKCRKCASNHYSIVFFYIPVEILHRNNCHILKYDNILGNTSYSETYDDYSEVSRF